MIECPYGKCKMIELCKRICVRWELDRWELEERGYVRTKDGTLELRNQGFTVEPEWLDDPYFPYPIHRSRQR